MSPPKIPTAGLHDLVREQSRRTPGAVALVAGEERLTYGELVAQARALAAVLREEGAGPETVVGLCAERSAEMVIGLLAILDSGAAYLPLDPAYPRERLAFMLEDAGVSVVLTRRILGERLALEGRRVVLFEDLPSTGRELEGPSHDEIPSAPHLAYLIYTSGSTGRPKGVAIEHRSAVALVEWALEELGEDALAGALAATSICFDLSIFEIFAPLAAGGRVILADNVLELPGLAAAGEVTLVNSVPSALSELLRHDSLPPSVSTVIVAGEPLRRPLVDRLYGEAGVETVINAYGPSEETTYSTFARLPRDDDAPPPIGDALPGTSTHVLDRRLGSVADGEAGELGLGGLGLARGYLGRPARTAESFVPDPFGSPGARLYRTGDRVRRRGDGALDFLGRLDHQVKVRGFRIELGEVESVLVRHPAVGECVAVARPDAAGELHLVAYVVAAGDEAGVEAGVETRSLRSFLGERLPVYMVPSRFVALAALPKTPNGKIDRARLPVPADDRSLFSAPWSAPETATEERLVEILGELCGVARIGRDDGFFELGGHSLLATQLVARLRAELGVEVTLRTVLEGPTVAGLAAAADGAKNRPTVETEDDEPPLCPRGEDGPAPLSLAQERVWFLHRLDHDQRAYQFQAGLRLRGKLDQAALRHTLDALVARHEAFRTTFPEIDGQPRQRVHPPGPADLAIVDLGGLGPAERLRGLEAVREHFVAQRLDVEHLPLVRWVLVREAPEEHLLLQLEHHLIHDGWSFNLFLRDFVAAYRAFAAGRRPHLPELAVQFTDVAVWQRRWLESPAAERQRDFWRHTLEGHHELLELPWDRPRPPRQTYRGEAPRVRFEPAFAARLRERGRAEGVTLYMIMLAGFLTLLRRLSGRRLLDVGCGIANRRRQETEEVVGMLVNNIVLRTSVGDAPSFRELLRRVRATTLEAYEHQDLPFDEVVRAVRPPRDLSYNPLFQVMFSFHDSPLAALDLGDELQAELRVALANHTAKFDLNIIGIPWSDQRRTVGQEAGELGITQIWEHNLDLFDSTTIDRMIRQYRHLLAAAAERPEASLEELPLLGPAERHHVVTEMTDTVSPYPCDATLPQLFARVAERWPERVALAEVDGSGDAGMTYGELHRRARRLARTLRAHGVRTEDRVGLFLERSPELLVAILAVLEADGAYVPLDVAYPAERLEILLEDAGVCLLLTTDAGLERLPEASRQRLDGRILRLGHELTDDPLDPAEDIPRPAATPEQLAYVLYTSGSTGRPKGVAVTHRNVVRLVCGNDFARLDAGETFLQLAPVSFDASTLEIWGALCHGGRLVLAGARPPGLEELGRWIEESGVTTLWLTAGLFHQVVEHGLDTLRGVRQLLAGGDVLAPDLVRRALEELPETTVVNGYGPTENTTFTACHRMRVPADTGDGSVPVGRPIRNTTVHVLDAAFEPVPLGVPGELWTGGDGVARGYLDRPAATAEAFVPSPWGEGRRLYRTGDLARWRRDGRLDFLGRRDRQVKVRGFRIEPGEIESVLAGRADLAAVVAVAWGERADERRLVAYVVPADSAAPPDPAALRRHCRLHLPASAVPNHIVILDALPLDPNGKVDRVALPAPDAVEDDGRAAPPPPPPEGPVEEALAEIWTELLGREVIARDDDFFDLGGHSLLGTRLVSRIWRSFEIELPLDTVLREPTIARLAGRIDEALLAEIAELGEDEARALLEADA